MRVLGQTAATVAVRGAWDRNQAGREKNAVKRTVMNSPESAPLPANSTEESPQTKAKGNREQ